MVSTYINMHIMNTHIKISKLQLYGLHRLDFNEILGVEETSKSKDIWEK